MTQRKEPSIAFQFHWCVDPIIEREPDPLLSAFSQVRWIGLRVGVRAGEMASPLMFFLSMVHLALV